jgi:2-polyprenyl-6-methoxyphenol hydroxylase-like FAD-dependent oxidoreductase
MEGKGEKSMLRDETQVLVVGAGPVGMLAALRLANEGVKVRIIDKANRTAAHSYACGLYPHSLGVLDRASLGADLLALGRRIDNIGFYEGSTRKGEIKFFELDESFPYVLSLSQGDLEKLLEERLKQAGVTVEWSSRLAQLETKEKGVSASVERLRRSGKGYVVPYFEWEVESTFQISADFVIGADGCESIVRRCIGCERQVVGEPEAYVIYEFESDGRYNNEIRVNLDETAADSFWPLPGNRVRWNIQTASRASFTRAGEKERRSIVITDQASDPMIRNEILRSIRERAPWFEGSLDELEWSKEVQHQPFLVNSFGHDRCWLAGDAAHQAGFSGMQSMNMGLGEAENLANRLAGVLENDSIASLEAYYQNYHEQCEHLLGLRRGLEPSETMGSWMREHWPRILPCIPASEEELRHWFQAMEAHHSLSH